MTLDSGMFPTSPYYTRRGFDVKGLAGALDMDQKTLARISRAKRQTVSTWFKKQFVQPRSENDSEVLKKLNRILSLLTALTSGEEDPESLIQEWFYAPNAAFNGEYPIEMLKQQKFDVVINRLMDALLGAQGG